MHAPNFKIIPLGEFDKTNTPSHANLAYPLRAPQVRIVSDRIVKGCDPLSQIFRLEF